MPKPRRFHVAFDIEGTHLHSYVDHPEWDIPLTKTVLRNVVKDEAQCTEAKVSKITVEEIK